MRFRTKGRRSRCGAVIAALVACMVVVAPAQAGTMKQWVCHTASGAPTKNSDNWSGQNGNVTNGSVGADCNNPGVGGITADMTNVWTAFQPGAGMSYTYTAPAGTSISAANLKMRGAVYGDDQAASMGIVIYRGGQYYDGDHVLYQCQRFTGCSDIPTTANYVVNSPVFVSWLGCGSGTPGTQCGGGNRGFVSIEGGSFTLVDDAAPTVSAQGGTLLQDLPLKGTETLTFSAADVGVGVADVEVRIGNAVAVPRQKLDVNSGKCTPVEGGYLWPVPCKTSLAASFGVDTTKAADGLQTLTVTVWDAAGNATTAVSRRVNIANTVAPPANATPAPPTINDLVSNNGQGGDPSTGALVPSRKRKSTRVNHGGTVRVQGHVRDAQGRPIVDAQIDVFEQVSVEGSAPRPVGSITTDDKGGYSFKSNPRSSRRYELRYSRQRGASIYQSTHELLVAVRASITFRADRTSIPSYGKATLRGRVVLDDLPSGGALLQIRARDGKRWLKVGTPRTNAKGQFSWTWKFRKVRRGSVVFQARLLQTGDVPAVANNSRAVRIRIG